MGRPRPVLRVGLTGGIASGKSTVAGMLADFGAFVLDADELAHDAMTPGGPAHAPLVERFGREILDEGGRIDRAVLGRRVFGDADERRALNEIVHPHVRAEADRRIAECARLGCSPLAVFDAALLVETGAYRDFHRLVVVRCSREQQLGRLAGRDDLTPREAQARVDAQASVEDKVSVADYVIDTEGPLDETRAATRRVYSNLLADYEREFE